MEIVIKLLDILIWPFTIFIIIFLFRSEFRKILSRLSHLKYKDIEANFTLELEKAENTADIINIPQLEEKETNHTLDKQQLTRISEISPRAAIFEAWFNVENEIKNISDSLNLLLPEKGHDLHIMKSLQENNIVNDEAMELYYRLKKLRNEAVHTPDFNIDSKEARRYLDLSKGLIAYLQFTVKNIKK